MAKVEGYASFYRGMSPSLTRTVPGVTLYIFTLHKLETELKKLQQVDTGTYVYSWKLWVFFQIFILLPNTILQNLHRHRIS